MKDEEPEDDELPPLEPQEQRAVDIRLLEYRAEDLAESIGFSQTFERTKQIPHYSAVRSNWENACVNFQYTKFVTSGFFVSELRRQYTKDNNEAGIRLLDALHPKSRGRPKAKPANDFNFLRIWMHVGGWLLSHEDRALFMELLFHRKNPLNAEALRKQGERLGLLGYGAFPKTYRRAPLSFFDRDKDKVIFKIASRWKSYFTGLGVENNPDILVHVTLPAPLS